MKHYVGPDVSAKETPVCIVDETGKICHEVKLVSHPEDLTAVVKQPGPALGLTPVLNQSGESHRVGRVSLCGDAMMRALLYEAAQVMLTRVKKWSWLKVRAMNLAKRGGHRKAIVALARRLAVIMHRIWSDGTEFRWTRESMPIASL